MQVDFTLRGLHFKTASKDLVFNLSFEDNAVSRELLPILREYRHSWIDTNPTADTAIGRHVEALLGIDMNDSPLPDHKGIELKSFRSRRPSIKKNLFCKVPDWDISYLKSAVEIEEDKTIGPEQFMFNKIEHTRNSIVSQFDILLLRGAHYTHITWQESRACRCPPGCSSSGSNP